MRGWTWTLLKCDMSTEWKGFESEFGIETGPQLSVSPIFSTIAIVAHGYRGAVESFHHTLFVIPYLFFVYHSMLGARVM